MIVIFSGLPGAGKSVKLADTLLNVLARNRKIYEKNFKKEANKLLEEYDSDWKEVNAMSSEQYALFEKRVSDRIPPRRMLWTNLQFTQKVEDEFSGYFQYWRDLRQLTPLRDVDIAIDEVATYFDARLWETLSLEMRRWLAQHRKFGIEIYGTTQDFAQVDKSFRRLTSNLIHLTKMIGSGDISPTRPAPKYVWGFVVVKELDPTNYDEQKSKFQKSGMLPSFMWISRSMTEVFDTRAEVKMSKSLPLHHIEKECELDNCQFHKVVHV
jgi:hypothetical protein